ncbi:MAG TPA: hypothetical protein VIG44_09095, partial [Thermomicrobiales bacterium]
MTARRMQRREFLGALGATAAATILAACGGSQQVVLPTNTPAASQATTGQTAGSAAAPTVVGQASPAAPPANVAQIPRNQTLIMSVSDSVNQFTDAEIHNPFLPTVAQRTGWHFAFEPFYYYDSVWTDKVSAPPGLTGSKGEIPYQAESYQYNADFTELTVKLR